MTETQLYIVDFCMSYVSNERYIPIPSTICDSITLTIINCETSHYVIKFASHFLCATEQPPLHT
jgi:hypothetical protein